VPGPPLRWLRRPDPFDAADVGPSPASIKTSSPSRNRRHGESHPPHRPYLGHAPESFRTTTA
jgi:hypothetical protein